MRKLRLQDIQFYYFGSTETASLHRTRRDDNFTAKQNPQLTLIWTDICSSRLVETRSNEFVLIFYLPFLQHTSIPLGTQYFSPQSHPAHKNLPFPLKMQWLITLAAKGLRSLHEETYLYYCKDFM